MNASPSLQSSLSGKSSDALRWPEPAHVPTKLKNNFELSVFFRHAEKEESKPVVRVLGCVVVVCWLPLCSLVVQVCVLLNDWAVNGQDVFQKWCKSLFYWETNSCNMSKPTFKGQFKRSQVRGRYLLKHIHSLLPGSGLKDKETLSHLAHPALLSLTASYFRAHFKIAYSLGSPKVYLELYVAALPEMVFGCSSVQI